MIGEDVLDQLERMAKKLSQPQIWYMHEGFFFHAFDEMINRNASELAECDWQQINIYQGKEIMFIDPNSNIDVILAEAGEDRFYCCYWSNGQFGECRTDKLDHGDHHEEIGSF